MTRMKGILAAGTLTGLVLFTILALGFSGLQAQAVAEPAGSPSNTTLLQPAPAGENPQETILAWQTYSRQLEATIATLESSVSVLQERDAAYQVQLETANNTILQLQDSINSANAAAAAPTFIGDDHFEHDDHEQFEHDD